jgi:DNA-binding PadR family transcriptional regulator
VGKSSRAILLAGPTGEVFRILLDTDQPNGNYVRNGCTITVTDSHVPRHRTPEELLPLTPPVFHILVVLAEGERHGYGIMQQVAEDTGGDLQLGPGTLYGCLQRMLAAGLIEESDRRRDPEIDDERRRYYRITDLGGRTVRAEAQRLQTALAAARARKLLPKNSGA